LTGLLANAHSRKNRKPASLSPPLQKLLTDLLPGIMGEIVGRCTEIGAKLGSEVGARPKAESDKP
jgi:hypothetical protein